MTKLIMQRLRNIEHTPRCILAHGLRSASSWSEPAASRRLRRLHWPRNKLFSVHPFSYDTSSVTSIERSPVRHLSALRRCCTHARSRRAMFHSQLLACDEPSKASKQDFLAQIQSLSPNIDSSTTASAVILVTKHFASLLADNDEFIQHTLQKLWAQDEEMQQVKVEISVLAAVVDAIPGLDTSPAVAEGIAICASKSFNIVDSTIDTAKTIPELHTRALKLDEQPPTISVQFLGDESKDDAIFEVMLPIASTLFHTNRPSTISQSYWSFRQGRATKRTQGLKKNGNYIIKLPLVGLQPSLRSSLPLAQLTGPRMIRSVMGNVVRELEEAPKSVDPSKFGEIIGQEGGGITSASRELEEAVAALITMPERFRAPVQVWALVIPEELTSSSAFAALTRSTNMALENINSGRHYHGDLSPLHGLILEGASLRRVLSGGGGWGNKAGLLSLDPHHDYAQRSSDELFDLDGSDPMSFLRGVAAPGDRIVFYALVDADDVRSTRPILEFGVVPSTMDDIPRTAVENHMNQAEIKVSLGRFGFSSELGMSITNHGRLGGPAVRSRIDAPFSNISLDLASD